MTIAFFVLALILSSLIEYWFHRSLHIFPWFGTLTTHYKHHYEENSGILEDFRDFSGLIFVFCPLFWVSFSAGIGASLGGLVFAAFATFAHQLQHHNPSIKCFWMKVPVHTLHHRYDCRCNFGISIDFWDRVFGTYKPNQRFINKRLN